MKKIVIGILAHVDAGKTTLSEAILYESGMLRSPGRVDRGDAFLDTHSLEKERGITIFSKQAVIRTPEIQITLLDTPGHVDFAAETERTLPVLDYAVLVINGADGVRGHALTLWKMLERFCVPVFLFVNKMDQDGVSRETLLEEMKNRLHEGCFDVSAAQQEEIAMCDEEALEEYIRDGRISASRVSRLIGERKCFPCFFGSALKLEGVEELLRGIMEFTLVQEYPEEFSAKVFKVSRDDQGMRLTHMKVTGGILKVRQEIPELGEKISQIRIYSGQKYSVVPECEAGEICAVSGLSGTRPGDGLGAEKSGFRSGLAPVLNYRLCLPEGTDAAAVLPKLRQLEEEEPQLHVIWNERLREIQVQLMGEVQMEVLERLIRDRFGITAAFDEGHIVYKETIEDTVEGVGHFEPLRHYAEVHLLLEPGERGSGLQFSTRLSTDELDTGWQKHILSQLAAKEHKGVLTGSDLTDIKMTLVAGRDHKKHTDGGDFREAARRAVRQGLQKARSVLLEPFYDFRIEVPAGLTGRVMTDVERMAGRCGLPQMEGDSVILTGTAPVAAMRGYRRELAALTGGIGRMACTFAGYEICRNAEEVIEASGYDAQRDTENPSSSVFCANGAGFTVEWEQVEQFMHLPGRAPSGDGETLSDASGAALEINSDPEWIAAEEVDAILARAGSANKKDKFAPVRRQNSHLRVYAAGRSAKADERPEVMLVDGYNVIYTWEELKDVATRTVDGARGMLQDILCNYQAVRKCRMIVVFDAYRIPGHETEITDYHNIEVVFTKEGQTADQYIEQFAHSNRNAYRITVATSDAMEQLITSGQGCALLSARELREEIKRTEEALRERFQDRRN